MKALLATVLVLVFNLEKHIISGYTEENILIYSRARRQNFIGTTSDGQSAQNSDHAEDNSIIEVFNECKCVPHFQCDENGFLITDGTGLLEERLGNDQRITCNGGSYPGYLVCCKVRPEVREPTVTQPVPPPTETSSTSTTPKTHDNIHDDRPNDNNDGGGDNKGKKPRKCGTQLPLIDVRISTGGDEPAPMNGEFPWLTVIYLNQDGKWKFKCAGSLIHSKVILTVNHCVKIFQPQDLKVVLNPSIDRRFVGSNPTMERNIQEIIKHPDYNSGNLYNDIALLILDQAYDVNDRSLRINTICLRPKKSLNNRKCIVAGWGKEIQGGNMASILKKVELPIVDGEQCQTMLRSTRLGEFFLLNKQTFICAGGEKFKDSCKGDGGGPLMCPPDNGANSGMFIAGMVSWGVQCGLERVPGVYTNVANYYEWISDELNDRGIQI